jgi:threonine/homoserine/homoserine lactone efflux protein
MTPNNYLLFVQLITILFITPGLQRILIITNSMNYGFPKSLWTGLGDVSANAIQMILATFGVNALMKSNSQIFDIFKWIGELYLIYLAIKFLIGKPALLLIRHLELDQLSICLKMYLFLLYLAQE